MTSSENKFILLLGGVIMKRKIYQELLNWKNENMKKPLMVIGARQIGKTYIIDKFCKEEFEDYAFNLNFFLNLRAILRFCAALTTFELRG